MKLDFLVSRQESMFFLCSTADSITKLLQCLLRSMKTVGSASQKIHPRRMLRSVTTTSSKQLDCEYIYLLSSSFFILFPHPSHLLCCLDRLNSVIQVSHTLISFIWAVYAKIELMVPFCNPLSCLYNGSNERGRLKCWQLHFVPNCLLNERFHG